MSGPEDFAGREINPDMARFETLVSVAVAALEVYESERNAAKEENMEEHNNNVENADEPNLVDNNDNNKDDDDDDDWSSKIRRALMKEQVSQPKIPRRKRSKTVMVKQSNGEPKLMSSAKGLAKVNGDDEPCHEELATAKPVKEKKHNERRNLKKRPTDESSSRKTDNDDAERAFKNLKNEEWVQMTRSKKNRQNLSKDSANPPPGLPPEFEREIVKRIDVTKPNKFTRLIHKSLYKTDVSASHGRVSMPCSQVESFEFLKSDEMMQLRNRESITVPLIHKPTRNGVAVNEADPLVETAIEFAEWDLHYRTKQRVSPQYVLRTAWNKVVAEDELKTGDVIQIWAFRNAEDRLCMALVVVERGIK